MMERFRRAIDHLELKEVPLIGRKFTWTNSQKDPTMTRIDRAFITLGWDNMHQNYALFPLASNMSDHTPLLLDSEEEESIKKQPLFKFELGWLLREGFFELLSDIWQKEKRVRHPYRSGKIKLGD